MTTDSIHIREVWDDNLEDELKRICDIVDNYRYVGMDTEFAGAVLRPVGVPQRSTFGSYETLKINVDFLKLIQLGLTFADEKGNLPTCGTDKKCVWQFNFREFNQNKDIFARDSINLLSKNGIDFQKNSEKGVDAHHFSQLLGLTRVLKNDRLHWVTFHGASDFGYLLKLISGRVLPETKTDFLKQIKIFFPTFYDVKHLIRHCNGLYGSLSNVAESLCVERVGRSHLAGSDSLVTCGIFLKLKELKDVYPSFSPEKDAGVLYKLQ